MPRAMFAGPQPIALHSPHLPQGRKAIYVPGWDTHGLPIELKALQSLSEGERRNLEPLALRRRCRKFALKTIDAQRTQFKRHGEEGGGAGAPGPMRRRTFGG